MKPGNPVKVWDLSHALTVGVLLGESTDAEMTERWASVKGSIGHLGRGERATSEKEAIGKVRELIKRRRAAMEREGVKLAVIEEGLSRGVLPMAKAVRRG